MTPPTDEENPLASIAATIAFTPDDWSQDHRKAWIYGIACGWGEALPEIAAKHRWTPASVARLQRLRDRYAALAGKDGK